MFRSSTAYYTTPPRPTYLLHQAHSHHAQTSPSSTPTPVKEDSPEGSRYAAALLDRPNKISHLLLPFVSKFEALDALSYEMKIPSLRPAPLQITKRSSLRRGGLDGPTSIKLESIFSPRKRNRSRYGDTLLGEIVASSAEIVPDSGTTKRSVSGRLKRVGSLSRVNTAQLREKISLAAIKERSLESSIDRTGDINEITRRRRENSIVRARIRFYDGCIEGTSVSVPCPYLYATNSADGSAYSARSAASTANANSSLRQNIVPNLPRHHKPTYLRQIVTKEPSSPSTIGGSKTNTNTIFTKSGPPQTPTKSDTTSGSRLRRNVSNPFLQAPHTNPPTREVSPKSFIGQAPGKRSIVGRPLFETGKVPDPIKKDAPTEDRRFRARAQQPTVQRVNPGPQDRGETGAKHEALDSAEILERADDRKIIRPDPKDHGKKMQRERGVVGETFESSSRPLSKAVGTRIPMPKWRDFSNPARSAPPWSSTTPLSTAAPKSSKKAQQIEGNRNPSLRWRDHRCLLMPTNTTCRDIDGKIKAWESRANIRDEWREKSEKYPSHRRMDNRTFLRKSIFENPWSNEVGNLQKQGLDGQEARAVVHEFQDIGVGDGLDDAIKGRRKLAVAPDLGRAGVTVTASTEGEMEDGSGHMGRRIIVREACCGLAEPKPLRLLEMERMLLLCRDRVALENPTNRGGGGAEAPRLE